ncbi:MAG TPA: GDSL-type esterase/lipase family protein [bacterium]|mgnify:CR=1 FL=1|nr:GDSL-type esterase/lipase family protein [bacterium]HOM27272.1 GDSL-type esterase/lipase family protein [bacterium]
MKNLFLLLFLVLSIFYSNLFSESNFPLKDGDTWVFLGDSITAQKLHTNYFEGYCFTRFPKWNIHFRNSGVGGDTIPRALARFDWDVAAWKPTIVSVELGMNDSGAGPDSVSIYINGMETLIKKIKEIGAMPVIFSPSPVNDGSTQNNLIGRNITLDKYTVALEEFTKNNSIIFADQFHFLVNLWGKNKTIEEIYRFADLTRNILTKPDLPAPELLKKWLEEMGKSEILKKGVNIGGDPVHPGPVGQLMMCAILLEKLNAPKLISKAVIDISNKKIEQVQCKITNLKIEEEKISFDRIDDCLPMPIPPEAKDALIIYPQIADLSQWILKIENLKKGEYEIFIDGVSVATVSSEELKNGWNLSTVFKGPVYQQCLEVLSAISLKENLVSEWRKLSSLQAKSPTEENKTKLQNLTEQILQADQKIKETAQPKIHNFTISLKK